MPVTRRHGGTLYYGDGIHIVIALATIMMVWFGVQEALASAHGGPGFSMGRFLNLFMQLTFAYAMVNYYDTSIPGLGFSIKGFIDGGTINLVNLSNSIWTDNQRIHQFCSDGSDGNSVPCTEYGSSYGGVTFNIDGDVMDAPVVPGQHLPAPTPLLPENGATNVGTTPTFSWTSVSGATYYRLVVAPNAYQLPLGPDAPSCTPTCLIDLHVTTTSYTIPSGILQNGTSYAWEVQAGAQFHGGLWSLQYAFSSTSTSDPTITSLTASPATIGSGAYTQLTVTISAPAPSAGATVNLVSPNSNALPLPSYITVPAGQTSASIYAHAGSVGASTSFSVTATYNNSGQLATVTILPSATNLNTAPATSITASCALLSGR